MANLNKQEENMRSLISLWNTIQSTLFPWLEEELDPLTERQKHFVSVIELMNPDPFLKQFNWIGNGRKPEKRLNLLKAFVAKAVYDFTTTEILVEHLKSCKNLRRLCGWETVWKIPSLSTFSRLFDQFAESGVLIEIHRASGRRPDTERASAPKIRGKTMKLPTKGLSNRF